MSYLFALALRVLLTASLLLAGGGTHAGAMTTPESATDAALQPPCHDGIGDAMADLAGNLDAAPASLDAAAEHCGKDCHCPCIALPMLIPHGISLIEPATAVARSGRIVLPWRSTTSLPSLRPPIA